MITAFYNDNNPYAAQWLQNLIDTKCISRGKVDGRSIRDLSPKDFKGYDQCHFFAGIAGWARALELADWPSTVPVWTGSCPCQPFSITGEKRGFKDERDLWPIWFKLIKECHPPIIFGEQVATRLDWYDRTANNLEQEGYTTKAGNIPANYIGAKHLRRRLWFVAYSKDRRLGSLQKAFQKSQGRSGKRITSRHYPRRPRRADGLPFAMDTMQAFGNAIVPQVAARFILACMDEWGSHG